MRILYVGSIGGLRNAGLYYLFPPRIVQGFVREGHCVYTFNDRDVARSFNFLKSSRLGLSNTNQALIDTCRQFMPDLVILAHCENIRNQTLPEIRTICPSVKIIHLNVDPVSEKYNYDRMKNRVGFVDGIFVTTAGDVLREFTSEKTFAAFVPNPADSAIDIGKAFASDEYDADLFFAAAALRRDDHRKEFLESLLKKITHVSTEIIGAGMNEKKLFGHDYIRKLSRSKMGLIINKTEDYYLYASDRMSQYMANGMMVFAHEKPAYTDIFSDGEIVTYGDVDDLADKISYYASHDTERIKISEKGYHAVHRIFDNRLIARYMIDLTFDRTSSVYPWPSEKVVSK